MIYEDAPQNHALPRGGEPLVITLGASVYIGLLGRWRPISGHLRHARLANSSNYWQRRSSRNWLGNRLAIIPSPS
jgi:hypothetical protein